MTVSDKPMPPPLIGHLGEDRLLVRFGAELTDAANQAALSFAIELKHRPLAGVIEVQPNLVSVLLRYDVTRVGFFELAGEVRIALARARRQPPEGRHRIVRVRFGGAEGPDLAEAAEALGLDGQEFVRAHNSSALRVLATGFAPGFLYCGFHPEHMRLPRRSSVRPSVPHGSVLFAAGQTAIAATRVPTGWYLIGRTDFINFDASRIPPVELFGGDTLTMVPAEG